MAATPQEIITGIVDDIHDEIMRTLVDAGSDRSDGSADIGSRLEEVGMSRDAEANVRAICERMFGAEVETEPTVRLLCACAEGASPDLAVRNVERYLDRLGTPSIFMSTIASAPPLLNMITTVFGASQYMADILVRNPGNVYWLMEKATWDADDSVEHYRKWFGREAELFRTTESKINAVRRAHRQALLKIGILDLTGDAPVSETVERLSNLADAAAQTILDIVASDEAVGLSVIALGKLGSRELNYSSDIDLIFVANDADPAAIDQMTKAARRFTEAMSEVTAEGYLYRVDLRLRPDGHAGQLVGTESSTLQYYQSRGRPWEFQTMLKARVIAGDETLGNRVIDKLHVLTFGDALSATPVDDIAAMRTQIHENIPAREKGFNIKLMAGGIRDVEFTAQAMQLKHGKDNPALRTPSTLGAFAAIKEAGLLEEWEIENLVSAYTFFRLVEHRVQMMHQIKTHTVPQSPSEIALLASRVSRGPLGQFDTEAFLDALSRHLNNVRSFAETFFEGGHAQPYTALLLLPDDDDRTVTTLTNHGFSDTRRTARTLHTMTYGSFPRFLDREVRASFERILPTILERLGKMGDPDGAVVNLSRLASSEQNELAFYEMLNTSTEAVDFVCGLAGMSSYLCKRLAKQFDALESMCTDTRVPFDDQFEEISEWEKFNVDVARRGGNEAAERQQQQRHWFDRTHLHDFAATLRAGFRELSGGANRARVANRQIANAFSSTLGDRDDVALFALGSFAISEARINSDVDLVVVTDGASIPDVTDMVQLINRWFADGNILKLDYRLRGEGSGAPLVQDVSFYKQYFEKRVSVWERVAFAKHSRWWGDNRAGTAFAEILETTVSRPFSRAEREELKGVRRKLEILAPRKYRAWDTKHAPGGRYDIEYICAAGVPETLGAERAFSMPTTERIDGLIAGGFVDKAEGAVLRGAASFYALIEYLLELQEMAHPTSIEKHQSVSRYLDRTLEHFDLSAGVETEKRLEEMKRAVRAVYNRVFD